MCIFMSDNLLRRRLPRVKRERLARRKAAPAIRNTARLTIRPPRLTTVWQHIIIRYRWLNIVSNSATQNVDVPTIE